MNDQFSLLTDRLLMEPLNIKDDIFIIELVNTDGWLTFIGNRNIHSQSEAGAYIQKIVDNENTSYWTVKLKDNNEPIGAVTYIKRDYLQYHDIGFAFLPAYSKKGYAFEATDALLSRVIRQYHPLRILATTIPENISSIKLLKRLGLDFERSN